jgi:ATP-binding cassette subfamily B protein
MSTPTPAAPPVSRLVRSVLATYARSPGPFALVMFCLAYQVAFNLFVPLVTRHVFDDILPTKDREGLLVVAIAMTAALALRLGLAIVQERTMARVTANAMASRRARMFDLLQAKPAAYFAKTPAAETLTRFTSDLAVVEQATTRLVPRAMTSVLNIVGCIALMLVLDARLAVAVTVMLGFAFAVPRRLVAKAAASNTRRRQTEARLLATVQESVALHNVIRSFSIAGWVRGHHDAKLDEFRADAARATLHGSNVETATVLPFALVQVLVLCVGAYLVLGDYLTPGELIAFTSLVATVSAAMAGIATMLAPLIESASGFGRIEQLEDDAAVPGTKRLPAVQGTVRFEHVTFSYTGERDDLRDVTLEIPAGTKAAFVGPSGSGKSTALGLVTRANVPKAGHVRLDDADLAEIDPASLYAQMAIVAQESLLFNTTIRENIRLGRLGATDAEIEAAARMAEIHEPILAMARGYDTIAGERGGNLSGGQRQRIAIARAILREPKVLVLDEATSALDPATEEAVSKILDAFGEGRTTLSVTHRLATVKAYDRIFVMKDGVLVESGSHDELVAKGGLYHQLWTKQNGVSVSASGAASVSPELLGTMPLLSSLDEVARRELAGRFVTMTCGEGHELFRAGEPGDAFYVIARGCVQIEVPRGDKTIQRVLSEGDSFGEIALLSQAPRTATARTTTPCTLLVLPRTSFAAMVERYPAIAAQLRAKAEAHQAADRAS